MTRTTCEAWPLIPGVPSIKPSPVFLDFPLARVVPFSIAAVAGKAGIAESALILCKIL